MEELWFANFPALKILLLVNFFCEVENKGVQFTDLKDLQSNDQGMTNLFFVQLVLLLMASAVQVQIVCAQTTIFGIINP